MKKKTSLLDYAALFLALTAILGLTWMFIGDGMVTGTATVGAQNYNPQFIPGLQLYAKGLGFVMLIASIAYILLGRDEDIATKLDE